MWTQRDHAICDSRISSTAYRYFATARRKFILAETEHVGRSIKVAPRGTLRLKSFSGRVTISASDQPEVVIDAVRRATREQLDRIKLDIRSEGSTVAVDANRRDRSWFDWTGRNNVVETDFDIKVPRRTNLDISVFSAPVDVQGVEGSYHVRTFSSQVRLSDVVGAVHAQSFSGSVDIRTKEWQDNQTINVDTFSGSVQLHVPDRAYGTVHFNSFSGRLSAELPLTFSTSNRRSFTARLGSRDGGDGGSLRLKTFSGNVAIDK